MRPLAVVVLNVLRDRASEMSLAEEHQLVHALGLRIGWQDGILREIPPFDAPGCLRALGALPP